MTSIPHACFSATFPEDLEFSHPPGAFLARKLEACLRDAADKVDPFENWRDCGWILTASLRDRCFEVYFAPFGRAGWLLAIAPTHRPGLLDKLLGRKHTSVSGDLRALAKAVHRLLSALPDVSDVFWQFGGPPNSTLGVSSPEGLSWESRT